MKRSGKVIVILLTCILIIALAVGIPLAFYLTSDEVDTPPPHICAWDVDTAASKEATCEEKGIIVYKPCTCGETKPSEELPNLGHSLVNHEAKAPTCEEEGWDAYQTCERCDYTTKLQKDKLPHTLVQFEAKAPTCLESGWEAYEACSVCTYTTKTELDMLGHDVELHAGKEATCTDGGWSEYKTCKREGCTYNTQALISALGHKPEKKPDTVPTCISAGEVGETICSRCDTLLIPSEYIPMRQCAPITVEILPNCARGGYTKTYCSACGVGVKSFEKEEGQTFARTNVSFRICEAGTYTVYSENGAKFAAENATDGFVNNYQFTATEAGIVTVALRYDFAYNEENKTVSYNVYKKVDGSETAKLTHPTDADVAAWKDGTLTEFVDGNGYDWSVSMHKIEAVTATCENDGNSAGYQCAVCNQQFGVETINSLGHPTASDMRAWTNGTLAQYVDGNGKDWSATIKVLPKVAPTCYTHGLTEGYYCTTCGKTLQNQEKVVEEYSHPLDKVIEYPEVLATCHTKGYTAGKYCTECSVWIEPREEVLELVLTGAIVPEVIVPEVKPTCVSVGYTAWSYCADCHKILSPREEIPVDATRHSEVKGIIAGKAPTCVEAGWTNGAYCTLCGDITLSQQMIAPNEDHNEVVLNGKPATCTAKGLTNGVQCADCLDILVAQEEIPMLEHSYAEQTAKVEPTCTTNGAEVVYKCANCPATKGGEVIPALGHTFENFECTRENCDVEKTISIGLTYQLDDATQTCVVTGIGACVDTELVIPKTYNGYTVTGIATGAFNGNTQIEKVRILGCTTIGDRAFNNCSNLQSVEISADLQTIGVTAFYGSVSLTEIIFNGTQEQWDAVVKGEGWNGNVTASVTCTVVNND